MVWAATGVAVAGADTQADTQADTFSPRRGQVFGCPQGSARDQIGTLGGRVEYAGR